MARLLLSLGRPSARYDAFHLPLPPLGSPHGALKRPRARRRRHFFLLRKQPSEPCPESCRARELPLSPAVGSSDWPWNTPSTSRTEPRFLLLVGAAVFTGAGIVSMPNATGHARRQPQRLPALSLPTLEICLQYCPGEKAGKNKKLSTELARKQDSQRNPNHVCSTAIRPTEFNGTNSPGKYVLGFQSEVWC